MSTLLSGRTASALVFGVWTAFLVVVLVRSYLEPHQHSVYPIFANAAREWQQGVDIYHSTVPHDYLDRFRYAPIVAVCFAPFAALPDAIGGVLWRLVNAAVFFVGVVAFARSVFPGHANLNRKTVAMLAGLLFPLSLGSINNAQSNTLIVGCLLLGTAAAVEARWNLAALCLAVPVLFKVYPLSVVALLLLVQPRLGWRVGAAVAVGCLLPFALQEPSFVAQAYESWVNQVALDNRHTTPLENSYRDFHLLTRLVGLPMAERSYQVLQLVVAAVLAAVVVRGGRLGWPKSRQLRAAFDLGCCWIILFGPATENSTYALLAPTLAFAAWESLQDGQPAWQRLWLAATVSLFIIAVVVIATPLGKSVSFYPMPVGGLLLFAERLLSYCRPRREPATNISTALGCGPYAM